MHRHAQSEAHMFIVLPKVGKRTVIVSLGGSLCASECVFAAVAPPNIVHQSERRGHKNLRNLKDRPKVTDTSTESGANKCRSTTTGSHVDFVALSFVQTDPARAKSLPSQVPSLSRFGVFVITTPKFGTTHSALTWIVHQ